MASHIQLIMAQLLHLPPGPTDASQQVPWTYAPSGSLAVVEPDSHPVPAFAFCDLDGMAGALAGEDPGKIIECLSSLHVQGNQVFPFLPERTHIFPSLLLSLTYL